MAKIKLLLAAVVLCAFEAKAEEEYRATIDDAMEVLNQLESRSERPVPPSQSHVILLGNDEVKDERKVLIDAKKDNLKSGNILKDEKNAVNLKPQSGNDWSKD